MLRSGKLPWPTWPAPLPPNYYSLRSNEHCWVNQSLPARRVNEIIFFNPLYYMAGVCSRYNARSDWLSAASRQGIILP